MIPNKNLLLPGINFLLIVSLFIYLFLERSTVNEIVYVDSHKLFNEFAMSKEMKALGQKIYNEQDKTMDSLYTMVNLKKDPQTIEQLNILQDSVTTFRQQFGAKESVKIWARIKSYSKDFCEKKGYKMIVGSQFGETVLYGSPDKDITPELLIFINKRYEGNE